MPVSASKRLRNPLLTIHLMAIAGVFGTDLVLLALAAAGLAGANPSHIYPAAALVSSNLTLPLAVLALISGIILGLTSGWGLFKYWWVTIKLGITSILVLVLTFLLVPRLEAVAELASNAASAGLPFEARRALLIGPVVASTLLTVMFILAVSKPRWRLRGRDS